MPDIEIDLGAFESMAKNMIAIESSFSGAESFSHEVAGTVGHPGLASRVDDFASKWNIHREAIEHQLKFVSDSIASIHDTFVELDQRLAAQLERTMAAEPQ
ncbi:MAG: hypothetical protein JWN80_1308 [Microbacteriaceae bacterium]|nr:hypothetical protein [Microbacteriaceae bacterium]